MVSVIITSYNNETTVRRAINSVLSQNYDNCEVIAVDDCSTDKTKTILNEYGNRIKPIFSPQNYGLPHSRRIGIKNSNGEYIMFLDADDYLDSKAIGACIECQKSIDADIVQMKVSRRITSLSFPIPFNSKYDSAKALDACLYDERLFPVQCWGKLYKADLIKSTTPLPYDGFWGEDRLFNVPIIATNPKIVVTKKARYNYMWGGSTTSKFNIDALQDYKQVYQIKHDWVLENGFEQHIPAMQAELMNLLNYHVRHLINSSMLSNNDAIDHLSNELSATFWKNFKGLSSATQLYMEQKRSIHRVSKKLITALIK